MVRFWAKLLIVSWVAPRLVNRGVVVCHFSPGMVFRGWVLIVAYRCNRALHVFSVFGQKRVCLDDSPFSLSICPSISLSMLLIWAFWVVLLFNVLSSFWSHIGGALGPFFIIIPFLLCLLVRAPDSVPCVVVCSLM